ncbi:ABC transporter permease [Streptomyces sp. NPDC059072]|uniref:ABC transporter permease n=1 Tax=Streptomyces sp. NPDC059072 TaxID=3346715 RepID=UPI0036BDBF3E
MNLKPRKPSSLRLRDLLAEALAGVLQRPARSAMTALGTIIGVGAFVMAVGLTATASSQIDARFNLMSATEVTVEDAAGTHDERPEPAFPPDGDSRIRKLAGVVDAGTYWPVRLPPGTPVSASPLGRRDTETTVIAASPGLLRAANATLAQGRLYDEYHAGKAQSVVVVGASIASRLGISAGLETQPTIFIGDEPFTVVGIFKDVERKPELLLSVIVPDTTALRLWGPPTGTPAKMLVATRVGAAPQIAREAPTALRPDHPEYLSAEPPPDPKVLRSHVAGDLNQLFLVLAALCLVIGAVGIANTTLVSVLERTGEIGLRRALGAKRGHITTQFLAESATLGTLGGIVGSSIATVGIVLVSVARSWTPVIDPLFTLTAPAVGLLTGVLAGLYPAWRATRIVPAEALRH